MRRCRNGCLAGQVVAETLPESQGPEVAAGVPPRVPRRPRRKLDMFGGVKGMFFKKIIFLRIYFGGFLLNGLGGLGALGRLSLRNLVN